MDLWESDRPAVETRAATPAPATGTGVTVAPVQPFVFAPSIAPRLGIDMPSVPSGAYSEMTITTSLPASPKVKGGNADDTAGVITPITASPRAIRARMSVALEDVALIGSANFEAALRANVSMALSDAYDSQAIAGNGTSPNVNGLIAQLTDPTNPTAIATFDLFVEAYADAVDRTLWASSVEYGLDGGERSTPTGSRQRRSAAQATPKYHGRQLLSRRPRADGGRTTGCRRRPARSPAPSSIGWGRMGLRTASHPTWGTMEIDDIYTLSRSGQRAFTVHAMVGDKVLLVQPAAYSLAEFKVA